MKSRAGRGGSQPVEVLDETGLQRCPDSGEQSGRLKSFEGARAFFGRRTCQRGHRLPPGSSLISDSFELVELEEATRVKGRVAHAALGLWNSV
jgi:hypothetical protein